MENNISAGLFSETKYCPQCNRVISGIYAGTAGPCTCRQKITGWECPRCYKIHSPYSLTCDCHIGITSSGTANTPIK